MIHQSLPEGFDALDVEQDNLALLNNLYMVVFDPPKLSQLAEMERAVTWLKLRGLHMQYIPYLSDARMALDHDIVWLSVDKTYSETLYFYRAKDAIDFKLSFS